MPEMTGPEMIEALGDRVAHLPVIFVTGFAGDKGTAAKIVGRFPILRKPFTVTQLAATIDEAVARQHALLHRRLSLPHGRSASAVRLACRHS